MHRYYRLLLFFMLIAAGSGCKLYQYQPGVGLDRGAYQSFTTERWRALDKGNVLVLHSTTDTLELFDLILNKETNELVAHYRKLDGLPLYHFKRASQKPFKNFARPFAGVDGPATNQYHFFVARYTLIDEYLLKFNLNEINRIDRMRQSAANTWLNLTFIPVIYLMVVSGIYFVLLMSWSNV